MMQEFAYQGPRIRGASTTFQQWTITPAQAGMMFNTNDVLKFMGNISEGLYDPYRSHFEVTVQADNDVGLLQIDNSASSIIAQTIILSKQVQIQRIQDYDVLAAMLNDIGFSEVMCQNKQGEGVGYTNIPTNIASSCVKPLASKSTYKVPNKNNRGQYLNQYANQGGFLPMLAPGSSFAYWGPMDVQNIDTVVGDANTTAQGLGCGLRSYSNFLTFPYDVAQVNSYISNTGRALSVRAQNFLGPLTNGYPNAPWSIPPAGINVANQSWNYTNMLSSGFVPGRKYATSYMKTTPDINVNEVGNNTMGTCSQVGYGKPFAPAFCVGGNQPFISSTVPQAEMKNGMILPQPVPCYQKTFRMPLISGTIGIAIPPDQFQLIPAPSLKDITLQLSLNPYAFFTSGYSDVHQFDTNGMQITNMQRRQWKYTTFNWVWHLYTFNKQQILTQIKTKLYSGITISSNYWQLTSSYQLPSGSYVRNSFSIPVNVESLAQILMCFLSNQYTTKSFCRKQFRLSNNISSLQFKANGAYYPLQPIQGNAGNPDAIDTTGDNWPFLQQLMLSNNFLFNTNIPLPRINSKNFAVNGRIYNTNDTRTLLPLSLYNVATTGVNQSTGILSGSQDWAQINGNTAMGACWFHQNRYIGRAIYAWTFQPYGHSKGTINGLNTTNYRQFDVTLNTIPDNEFPTDETLCIFTRSNVLVRYFDGYIQVLGA